MSKRTASDFLARLSKVNTNIKPHIKKEKEEEKKEELPKVVVDTDVDLYKNVPSMEISGTPIKFNQWFNEEDHDFTNPRPKSQLYKSQFGIALASSQKFPNNNIELHRLLKDTKQCQNAIKDELAGPIFDYQDFYWTSGEASVSRCRKLAALHALNHVMEDFDVKNSRVPGSRRGDSGYTPTTVLVICPSKNQAFKFVDELLNYIPEDMVIEHEDDFRTEYYAEVPEGVRRAKPADWLEYFGGENDQAFKTGIRIFGDKNGPNRISLKQEMAKSQIVIASTLSIMSHEDKSFLSSIEICILDTYDYLEMQQDIRLREDLNCLNQKPLTVTDTDWSRVRSYFLNKNHGQMRQNIAYGQLLTPQAIDNFSKFGNIRGSIILKPSFYPPLFTPGIDRSYHRLQLRNLSEIGDCYLTCFKNKLLPRIKEWRAERDRECRTIILFQSSYIFLAARDVLERAGVIFLELADEATDKDSVKMRKTFSEDKHSVMIMTERFYFFKRPRYFDVGRVVFFGPPAYPQFATALAGTCESSLYFTEYDSIPLERIVGSMMAERLVKDSVYLL